MLNMIENSQLTLKSSPCPTNTRTAHSEEMVKSDIVDCNRIQEHNQRVEPVITVQCTHAVQIVQTLSDVQSNWCTLGSEDAHTKGVCAEGGKGSEMAPEVFTSVRYLVEEWERKEEEEGVGL